MNVGKKAWIIFILICLIIVAVALVLMLVLVPQSKASGTQAGAYEALKKEEYAFEGNTIATLNKQYGITSADVSSGKKNNKYEEGNINPFTPSADVTIYNEPTKENETLDGSNLTPDSK